MITAILYVLTVVGMWKVFEKLGEAGWKSIIPIYNIIVMLQLVKWDLWKILLFLIPIVGQIFSFLLFRDLAARFGKGVGFAIGMLFLPLIFFPILGFGGVPVQEESVEVI